MGQSTLFSGSYDVVDKHILTITRQAADLWRSLVRIVVAIFLVGVVLLEIWLTQ